MQILLYYPTYPEELNVLAFLAKNLLLSSTM